MIKNWKIRSSQYEIQKPPYMVLRKDHIQMENGQEIPDYYVFEYPEWVSVLGITADEKFVLIRQYRHGIGGVHYELPAGVVDEKEDLLESAKREFLEETGYGGGEWQLWLEASANPATHTNLCHIYLAKNVEKIAEQHLESTEEIGVELLDLAEIRFQLEHGGFAQALHFAALWKYFAFLPQIPHFSPADSADFRR